MDLDWRNTSQNQFASTGRLAIAGTDLRKVHSLVEPAQPGPSIGGLNVRALRFCKTTHMAQSVT
jgi:hypothetical protein